jgi:hypothetical protein
MGETFLALFDGRRPRSRSIAINGTGLVSMVHEMPRPPFFVELASDDGRLESWESGIRAAFFGFSKRISIPYGA